MERSFRSLKHSRLLNQHQFRGLAKLRLHDSLSLLTYAATMPARVQAGQMDKMRTMRVRAPATLPTEQMPLTAQVDNGAVPAYNLLHCNCRHF